MNKLLKQVSTAVDLFDVVAILSVGAIVRGVHLVNVPSAWIAGGALGLAYAIFATHPLRQRKNS